MLRRYTPSSHSLQGSGGSNPCTPWGTMYGWSEAPRGAVADHGVVDNRGAHNVCRSASVACLATRARRSVLASVCGANEIFPSERFSTSKSASLQMVRSGYVAEPLHPGNVMLSFGAQLAPAG